jgi:CubicO group peptidase (beta-lactamase class C family)
MTTSPFSTPFTSSPTPDGRRQAIFTARWSCWLLGVVAPILAMSATPAAGDELEDKLAAIVKSQDVPGIIAASVGPDGVIESAWAGVRKRGSDDAIATDDQLSIGSNSKSFTATLAAVLVDDDVIDWSTTISEVWPDQPVDAKFKHVTLEQLLAHTGPVVQLLRRAIHTGMERARMCYLLLTNSPEETVGKYAATAALMKSPAFQ